MGWPGTTATRCGAAAGRCGAGDWAAAGPDTRHANNQAESMDTATNRIRMVSLVSLVIENLTAQTPGGGSGRVGNIALAVLPGESVSTRILALFSTL
jgi:hypothetical protein